MRSEIKAIKSICCCSRNLALDIVSEHLVIFTRYSEVGRVKTRLIPALGVDAATALHRQMTEYTLDQVRAWRDRRNKARAPSNMLERLP